MSRSGHPTDVLCPLKHCGGKVLYNGNYFCENGDWHAPDGWLESNPLAYYNLMTWRAERRGVPVETLTNFNSRLYEKGRPHE